MEAEVKTIETEYNGYLFRSRLEARWAVFFDHAGIKYQYEMQGYETREAKYLPDFYLPRWETHVEVKGDEEQYHRDLRKMCEILKGKGSPVRRLLILGNIPYDKESNGIFWFPVLYYHALKNEVYREYRTFIWTDENDEISFHYNWSLIPDRVEVKYKANSIWEENYDKELLDPIPDKVFEPNGVIVKEQDNLLKPYREKYPSNKIANALSIARKERF